ncbi:DUF1727 domain-containing protein [bacterium]|nr:DUF1727 domain-containing protein [bacterium]
MKFRFYLSLIIARLAYFFLKITKLSSGTAIIGLIALKICPDFLSYANEFITNAKINITGTNGKTTTSGIISHLIKKENNSLINNSIGANMLNGIINTLALEINPFKKAQFSVIETDEAFITKIYEKMNGDYLLVTNLFEDQTDRFATPLITKDLIQKGICLKKQVQLILNANDPITASLTSAKEPIFYGIRNVKEEIKNISSSSISNINCPLCGERLQYEKHFYSHIGNYNCKCGYRTPNIKYLADVTLYENHSIINIANEEFNVPLAGLYNAYNALGAIALAKELNIKNIQENLKTFKTAFGRSEKRTLFGHETVLQLIKNPAGTNEVLKTIDLNSNILIAINNNIADGTDISWIDQVNFEILSNTNKEIIVTGLCADSVADRLKKANVKNIKTISDIKKAVEYIGKNANDKITILSSYTALLKINKSKEIKKCY